MFTNGGESIHVVTAVNGILNDPIDFNKFSGSMFKKIPENPFKLYIYNPTSIFGVGVDVYRTFKEMDGKETKMSKHLSQVFEAISEKLHNVNPKASWLHLPHSRSTSTSKCAFGFMSEAGQSRIKNQMIWLGLAGSSVSVH